MWWISQLFIYRQYTYMIYHVGTWLLTWRTADSGSQSGQVISDSPAIVCSRVHVLEKTFLPPTPQNTEGHVIPFCWCWFGVSNFCFMSCLRFTWSHNIISSTFEAMFNTRAFCQQIKRTHARTHMHEHTNLLMPVLFTIKLLHTLSTAICLSFWNITGSLDTHQLLYILPHLLAGSVQADDVNK